MDRIEREKYRLHARLHAYRRHVARANTIVARAIEEVPGIWAVGASGGKDSTVLAHLAHTAGWRGPLFHYWADEIPPENTAQVLALGDALGRPVMTAKIHGDFDFFVERGGLLLEASGDADRSALAAHDRRYRGEIDAAVTAAGVAGLFWGMRREESRARDITIRRYGVLYRARSRQAWTCHPLADWSGRDIWAYLLAHNLPWLSRYDTADDRERERSEITWIFGASADLWHRGQGRRTRESDPALWARLVARWPGLARYG